MNAIQLSKAVTEARIIAIELDDNNPKAAKQDGGADYTLKSKKRSRQKMAFGKPATLDLMVQLAL